MVNFEEAKETIEVAEGMLASNAMLFSERSCLMALLQLAKDLLPKAGHRIHGTVDWFNDIKGYGFVKGDDGQDAFLHKRALNDAAIDTVQKGERLEYTVVAGSKGLQARAVVRVA
jgi:CspA family cold shock protein